MKFTKRVLIVAGSIALASTLAVIIAPKTAHGVAALVVQVTNTSANPVVATTQTHLGVRASQIVTLVCSPIHRGIPDVSCRDSDWMQLPANGGDLASFSIPSGQALVITDFEWSAGSSGIAGFDPLSGALLVPTSNVGSVRVMSTGATLNPDGTFGGSSHPTAGVVVQALPDAFVNFTNGITGSASASFVVYGYLVPAN